MTPMLFERAAGDAGYWFTVWENGELRFFKDKEACTRFAALKCFTAVFAPVNDVHNRSEA